MGTASIINIMKQEDYVLADGDLARVRQCLAEGASPHDSDTEDFVALHYAVEHLSFALPNIVTLLLDDLADSGVSRKSSSMPVCSCS